DLVLAVGLDGGALDVVARGAADGAPGEPSLARAEHRHEPVLDDARLGARQGTVAALVAGVIEGAHEVRVGDPGLQARVVELAFFSAQAGDGREGRAPGLL